MERLKQQTQFLIEIDKVKGILRQSIVLGDLNRRLNTVGIWLFVQ